jgi:uncharacterized membrane protein YdjX (TVP38/TMEM64 family)
MGGAHPGADLEVERGPAGGRWRLAALALLAVAAVVVALTVDRPGVGALSGWLADAGPLGWAAVVLAVAGAMLVPVPRTAVSVLLGAAAGFSAGLAVTLAGGFLGGLAGFAISRALGRDAVVGWIARRRRLRRGFDRAERLLRDRGFWSVVTARVSPLPYMVVSYAAGLTGLRWRPYLLGTAVGLVPGSVLHVGIGAAVLTWL